MLIENKKFIRKGVRCQLPNGKRYVPCDSTIGSPFCQGRRLELAETLFVKNYIHVETELIRSLQR